MEPVRFVERATRHRQPPAALMGRRRTARQVNNSGCNGARSLVRETLGTGFPGGTYLQVF